LKIKNVVGRAVSIKLLGGNLSNPPPNGTLVDANAGHPAGYIIVVGGLAAAIVTNSFFLVVSLWFATTAK